MISRFQRLWPLATCFGAVAFPAFAQLTTTYSYDPQGQVRSVTSSVQNTSYVYDAAGNRTTVSNAAPLAGLTAGVAAGKAVVATPMGAIPQSFVYPAPPSRQPRYSPPPPPASPPPVPSLPGLGAPLDNSNAR